MTRPRVLYVDDDAENLVVFRMTFRKEFEVVTQTSGALGIQALEGEAFPVVLSDQRMPDMTGVEFLQQVRGRWPDTRRILITAYTDVNAVIDAINLGHVYQFVRKPWEKNEVAVVIKNALDSHDLEMRNRSLTEELLRKERLATLGQFVSNLAHEIRNQLNVRAFAETLLARYPSDEFLCERMQMIRNALTVVHGMVEEIREFARGSAKAAELQPHDVAALVDEAVGLLRFDPDLRSVSLSIERGEHRTALCQADKLKQVVINLVKNSAQAVQGRAGGEVRVKVGGDPATGKVKLVVRDNGCGIKPEHMRRLFEPFFSTKGDAGTGLGLSICKRIVEAHGGVIDCRSTPDVGTEVEITLAAAPLVAVAY
jgi:two-component system, NtrC family, sensor kinase